MFRSLLRPGSISHAEHIAKPVETDPIARLAFLVGRRSPGAGVLPHFEGELSAEGCATLRRPKESLPMPPSVFDHLWLMYLLGWFDKGVPMGHGIFASCDDCGRPE